MKSEQIDELATAIAKAQATLQPAHFDKTNPHFKSKFASLTSVMKAAKVFAEHGIGYTQTTGFITCGDQVRFVLELTLMHSSGQWMKGFYPLAEGLPPQQLGSALTYAKRYQLAAAFGISADDDDDGNAASVKTNGAVVKIIPEQVEQIIRAANFKNFPVEKICEAYAISSIEELPAKSFNSVIKNLEAK